MQDGVGSAGVRREWGEVVWFGINSAGFVKGLDDRGREGKRKQISVPAGP